MAPHKVLAAIINPDHEVGMKIITTVTLILPLVSLLIIASSNIVVGDLLSHPLQVSPISNCPTSGLVLFEY